MHGGSVEAREIRGRRICLKDLCLAYNVAYITGMCRPCNVCSLPRSWGCSAESEAPKMSRMDAADDGLFASLTSRGGVDGRHG